MTASKSATFAILLVASPAAAQTAAPPPGTVQSVERTVVADDLSRHLRTLAGSPENLEAAIGAGDATLALGDPHAAAGFYARAERIAVRDGRAKAGLARAFLALDRPRDALELFEDAVDLGIADAAVAGDRAFAWDLRGEPRRAQRDYQIALANRADDEVTRRYALSLGLTGERDRALQLLDPLLYRRDASAWRARAFVFALTGDLPSAMTIVRQVMPAEQAAALQPYLQRLPTMRATEKAAAVHLGRFPTTRPRRPAERAPAITAIPLAPPPAPVTIPPRAPAPAPIIADQAPVAAAVAPSARQSWVQLATGSETAMTGEWRRLRIRAAETLADRSPQLIGAGGATRLVVGPFETLAEARALVTALRTDGVTAFAWTAAAGTETRALR